MSFAKFEINKLDAKKLRNLRMNLNNRLESFKTNSNAKDLKPSHKLYGLGPDECAQLLELVKKAERKIS